MPTLEIVSTTQDAEQVTIKRAAEGMINAYGEPALTWAESSKPYVLIYPMIMTSAIQYASLQQAKQGTVSLQSYQVFFNGDADVNTRDRIVRSDGNTLTVESVQDYGSHKEAIAVIAEES